MTLRSPRVALAGLALAAALVAPTPAAGAVRAPARLHAFLLRADEASATSFARTPSFAWQPVRGATRYEFELSTSSSFGDNAIVWSTAGLRTPAVAVPISLPWITGDPYSLYAHVRAVTPQGTTRWSPPFGFNMRWPAAPTRLTSAPGLVRWKTVDGATRYDVWFVDAGRIIRTNTNVADEREHYTLHQDPAWTSSVRWRVRAVRWLYGSTTNGLPAVSYGPWSPTYTSYNPPFEVGPLTGTGTMSDVASDTGRPRAHQLMPGFTFAGTQPLSGSDAELYRVYVFTDKDCVNLVYRGAVVGSPAYAPRSSGPLALPTTQADLDDARTSYLASGPEGNTFFADGGPVTTSETALQEAAAPSAGAGAAPGSTGGPSGSDGGAPAVPGSELATGAKVDLWDTDWPSSGYYWTVVPVRIVSDGASIEYRDAEVTQDACASGRALRFGKTSEPIVTGTSVPYISGLSPKGRLTAAVRPRPALYGAPLVAWQPALGADEYEVQWSRTRYPWRTAGSQYTFATSATLPLRPGTWYYRVRGLNFAIPSAKPQMSWSAPVGVVVTRPQFAVVP